MKPVPVATVRTRPRAAICSAGANSATIAAGFTSASSEIPGADQVFDHAGIPHAHIGDQVAIGDMAGQGTKTAGAQDARPDRRLINGALFGLGADRAQRVGALDREDDIEAARPQPRGDRAELDHVPAIGAELPADQNGLHATVQPCLRPSAAGYEIRAGAGRAEREREPGLSLACGQRLKSVAVMAMFP